MRPEYESDERRDDSRYDSCDSRYDSCDSRYDSAPPPPPKRAGFGIAGLIVATVALGIEVMAVVLAIAYFPMGGVVGGGGIPGVWLPGLCLDFVILLVALHVLAICALATSITGFGLAVSGIVAGRGRGRRLGIYALVLAVLAVLPFVLLAVRFLIPA